MQVKVVDDFLRRLEDLPLAVQKVDALFALDIVDTHFTEMHDLYTRGLEVSVHRNVQMMLSLVENCETFLFIDPTIYKDTSEEWSRAWWGLIRYMKNHPRIKKTYLLLNGPADRMETEEKQAYEDVLQMAKVLEDHDFKVRYCDPRDVRRVDPSSVDLLSTAMCVVNQSEWY